MIGKTRDEISNVQVLKLQFYDYLLQPINPVSVNISPTNSTDRFEISSTSSTHGIALHGQSSVQAVWNIAENELIVTGIETTSAWEITSVITYVFNSLTKQDGTILTKFTNYPQ